MDLGAPVIFYFLIKVVVTGKRGCTLTAIATTP